MFWPQSNILMRGFLWRWWSVFCLLQSRGMRFNFINKLYKRGIFWLKRLRSSYSLIRDLNWSWCTELVIWGNMITTYWISSFCLCSTDLSFVYFKASTLLHSNRAKQGHKGVCLVDVGLFGHIPVINIQVKKAFYERMFVLFLHVHIDCFSSDLYLILCSAFIRNNACHSIDVLRKMEDSFCELSRKNWWRKSKDWTKAPSKRVKRW